MDFLEATQIAGLCLSVGAALFLAYVWSNRIRHPEQYRRSRDFHNGWRLDTFLGVVWSGMLLVQVPTILRHLPPPTTYHLSWLSFAATASIIFICGCLAGRLLLRLEIHRYQNAQRDAYPG